MRKNTKHRENGNVKYEREIEKERDLSRTIGGSIVRYH